MKILHLELLLFLILGITYDSISQCTSIRQQRNITFNTNRDCAPVDVTDYTITYFFNAPQAPADVIIRFEWNDPTNSVSDFALGDTGFLVGGGNTEFTATGRFSYPENDNCLFEPVAYVIVQGTTCETSRQTQLVSSWSRDNSFGGTLTINPNSFNVCFGTAINNAVFTDNSQFNCNINTERDNPNRQLRHTQFVYGTNHNPANSIRDLSLVDDLNATQQLTDNLGALTSTTTVNGVTGVHFDPIVAIPFPADVPNMTSFPISAPASGANAIGARFEITLYNWNICNPYNGNPANPNYADAIETQAFITVVPEPRPDFQTRLSNAAGPLQSIFCLGETIYFENLTTGGFNYSWVFFDDAAGNNQVGTSNNTNATFAFNTSGDKLIRLIATDLNTAGTCVEVHEEIVNISPAAVAGIEVYESSFTSIIDPSFCQNSPGTLTFEVGFRDATTHVEPDTEWRWELYDENGNLNESLPSGTGNYSTSSITDFTRNYVNPGVYLVRLLARHRTTGCQTSQTVNVTVYPAPNTTFSAAEACAGERTAFSGISDMITSLSPRLNNDKILFYDWDFSYDGVNFNPELRRTNNNDFQWFLDGIDVVGATEPSVSLNGTYQVALRLTTEQGMCQNFFVSDVTVNPTPDASLNSNYVMPICPGEEVLFSNGSTNSGNTDYELRVHNISDGSVNTIPFSGPELAYTFQNDQNHTINFEVYLRALNIHNCETLNGPISVAVLPSSSSGFTDVNYNPVTSNCSPWTSTFLVDAATQALDADAYTWTIVNSNGIAPGFPVIKNRGDQDFHQLDYQVVNLELTNQVYTATLEVTKSDICVDDAVLHLQINPEPSALFDVEVYDSCAFKIFKLEANQKGLVAYDWQFNPPPDQSIDQADVQLLRYERPGEGTADITASASLQTTNLALCESNVEMLGLNVDQALPDIHIEFSLSTDTIRLPSQTVTFQNNSTNDPNWTYLWSFGDGTTSNGYDPGTHDYTRFGSYTINLEISNPFCRKSLNRSLIVLPGLPQIDFEGNVLQGCMPLTVDFTNLSEFAIPGRYTWDFGDGQFSNQDEPSYTYFNPGQYTVSLKGRNELGTEGQTIKQLYIEVFPVPTANFALNPEIVFIPDQKVFFSNLSTNASSYTWVFGDGQTSTETSPTHTYQLEGEYDITLTAVNDFGCLDSLVRESAVMAQKGGRVTAPNAFTPSKSGPSGGIIGSGGSGTNGGNLNDVFSPRVEGVIDFHMLIYNKWGQVLFESHSQDIGWDGYFRGQLMPADVYVYKLKLSLSDGRRVVRLGDVTLVR